MVLAIFVFTWTEDGPNKNSYQQFAVFNNLHISHKQKKKTDIATLNIGKYCGKKFKILKSNRNDSHYKIPKQGFYEFKNIMLNVPF